MVRKRSLNGFNGIGVIVHDCAYTLQLSESSADYNKTLYLPYV